MTIVDPETRFEQQPRSCETTDEPTPHVCEIKAPRHARLEETGVHLYKMLAENHEVPFGD